MSISREELHRSIWSIADHLRGSVDGWDFKNYVLGAMFYRYISENIRDYINKGEIDAGNADFNYADLSDQTALKIKDEIIAEKGFFILPSQLFENILKNAENNEDLNICLETIFKDIETSSKGTASEGDFEGLFDDFNVNSNKLGGNVKTRNEKLAKLLKGIANMPLGAIENSKIDTFGDAYEYLMNMYASNAGKSGGEFFTPQCVSTLLTLITTLGKNSVNKIYDPACGSGSLLLTAKKLLGDNFVQNGFYGQEINITTFNLCRINMFLHNIGFEHFKISSGDTLTNPKHLEDAPFDAIVSNPPYSIKWQGSDNPILINDERFAAAGVLAPKSKADLAFIMHSLYCLSSDGVAAIVCFPGIFYRSGAEQKIRQYLIDNNFIDSVILLPGNLFFGTGIQTCILVLKKNKTDNNVLFIDAKDEYIKVVNKNLLNQENIDKILNAYKNRENIEHFAALADKEAIAENNYNLSVGTYVEPVDTREKIDIKELNSQIASIVAKEESLRNQIDKIIADLEN